MRVLRFITCGGANAGKSTLISRLLDGAKVPREDALAAIEADAAIYGADGEVLDFEPHTDRLDVRHEQGPGIDIVHRSFSIGKQKFMVADAAGSGHGIRDMVIVASTADLALVLIGAHEGVLPDIRRHSYLVWLLGIRHVALVVNKMDLVGYSEEVFNRIAAEYRALATKIGIENVACVPMSALQGDNVTARSANLSWYQGPSLIDYLENMVIDDAAGSGPFRMSVQHLRPDLALRGISGRVVGGAVRRGDRIRALPSGRESTVARIVTADGEPELAVSGQTMTLVLEDNIDIRSGDLLAAVDSPAGVANQFEAVLIWMNKDEMFPGRRYLLRRGSTTVGASIATPKYKVDIDTLEHLAARTLRLNDIGVCNLHLDQPIAFDTFAENRVTGSFGLIDPLTNKTIAAGLLHFALRRAQNIHRQAIEINKQSHAMLNGHKPCIVWFTGLSGAGKSTIANAVEKKLHALGLHTFLLDGDNVRHGLSKDLGFTEADRVENICRVAEVARLMVEAGLIVLVSFISPFRAERRLARDLVQRDEFCEVFVDAPLAVAELRDAKGLYRKARCGELKNFTGIDSPYEPPEHAEVRIDSVNMAPENAAELIIAQLRAMKVFAPP